MRLSAIVLATAVILPSQTRPDFSGAWVQSAIPVGGELWTAVTIKQTPAAIDIERIGTYTTQAITLTASVPLDTAAAKGTVTIAGTTSAITVTRAWEGQVLVVTMGGNTNATAWEIVERWSLSADKSTLSVSATSTIAGAVRPAPAVVLKRKA